MTKKIDEFHDWLNSDDETNELGQALRGLRDIEPEQVQARKIPAIGWSLWGGGADEPEPTPEPAPEEEPPPKRRKRMFRRWRHGRRKS